MCVACEQDAMWFAYLRRRGLITADGLPTEPVPFLAGAFETLATQEEKEVQAEQNSAHPEGSPTQAGDDQKAG